MIWTLFSYLLLAIIVIFLFGLCIFIHELGHFLAAKWRKLHIVAFSLGFRKIISFQRGGIEYRIGWLPFGGYVDIPQLDFNNENITTTNKSGIAKPIDRIIVAFAGPLFNIFLGLIFATFLWYYGIPQSTPKMKEITVASVSENSPEYHAGLRKGDIIEKINNEYFYNSWDGIVQKIILSVGEITLKVNDKGKLKTISYYPEINRSKDPMAEALAKEGLPYPFFKPLIPVIISVDKDSKAALDGLKTGDRIIKVDNNEITDAFNYVEALENSNGKNITIEVERGNKRFTFDNIIPTKGETPKTYKIGIVIDTASSPVKIYDLKKDQPAFIAGLRDNDLVIRADNQDISNASQLINIISTSQNKPIKIEVNRNNKFLTFDVTPKLTSLTYYYIPGVSMAFYNHTPPWTQFTNVITMTYQSIRGILSKNSYIKPSHMSGPVGIVSVIGTAVYRGSFIIALNIITIISFSLALFNLLPLPVLDGGHILIALIEIVSGKRLPPRILRPIYTAFVFILLGFMFYATFNDVNRLTNFKEKFTSKSTQSSVSNSNDLDTKNNQTNP